MYQFDAPFSMIICGPSRSGKTTFIVNLIKNLNSLVGGKSKISNILWCYKSKNSIPEQLKSDNMIQFIQGVPEDVNDIMSNTLIVFDDLMMDAFSKDVTEIFTVHSHHNNISTILVLHNLFNQNKFTRNITLNTQYIIYFKNPRDASSTSVLARQMCPGNWRNLEKLFNEATSESHSYLIIDLCQNTSELFKYRTNIFNKDNYFNCFATSTVITKAIDETNR
jgi:hypothetical protein